LSRHVRDVLGDNLINGYFGPLVRRIGFAAAPPGEARLSELALRDPDLWHPRRGPDCAPGATVRVRGRLVAPAGRGVQELVVITRTGRGPEREAVGMVRPCR
jgi:hypothetical protein